MAWLFVVQFLVMASTSSIGPIIIVYSKSLGASIALASIIAASFTLVSLPLQIPIGILSDRIGRGRLLYASSVISVIGPVLCYLAPNVPLLFAARLFHGLTQAIVVPLIWAVTMDLAPPGGSGKAIGNIGASLQLGVSAGPFVSGFVASYFDAHAVFLLSLAFALPNLFLTYVAVRKISLVRPKLASPARTDARREGILSSFAGAFAGVHRRNFIAALLVPSIATTAASVFLFILPAYAFQEKGLSYTLIGTILAVMAIGQVLVRSFLGSVSDRYGRKVVILAGFVLTGSTAFLLSLSEGFWAFLAVAVCFGFGYSLAIPAGAALVRDSIPSDRQGMGMGSYQTFLALGSTVGLSLMGFLVGVIGYAPTFVTVSVTQFAAVGLLAAAVGRRGARTGPLPGS